MIGKGSFAKVIFEKKKEFSVFKVYLAKRKENNKMYAIKAFSKQTILS